MSSIASGSRFSRKRSPSPTRSPRSVLNLDDLTLEDPVDADLKIIHQKEKAVFTLNDEVVALTSVIKNETNEQAMTENMNRKRKLRLIDYQEELDHRSAEISKLKDIYHDSVTRNDQLHKLLSSNQDEIFQLNHNIENDFAEFSQTLSNEDEIERNIPNARNELEALRDNVRVLNYSLQRRRDFVDEGLQLQHDKNRLLEEASQQELVLIPQKEELLSKINALQQRSLTATKAISLNPADTLQDEIRVINEIEQSVTHIEKQIRKTINADENMAAEVEKVREECEAFCQEVAARKKKLTVWRASMQNEADAIDRRLNKNDKLTTGTSIASSMANIQQKLAQTLVDNIFTKLEKRRKAAEARHEEIDKLEIKNRNEREERQIEYEQKMKKVAKLSEAYDIYEEMFVDVQFGIGQIDALKKEIIDLDFQIAKAKRLNAICEVNDQKINEENERLEPIKHDLEGRENTANEWEQKINAERERVEQYQSDIENSEKMSLQREKDTEALEEEAKQLQSRLNNLVTQVDNQFEVFTAEQATTAKASAATA